MVERGHPDRIRERAGIPRVRWWNAVILTASGYEQGCSRTRFVALILALSELVELPETIPPIYRHPGDDQIIACAVAGEAHVIVSGDRDLLVLERVGGIPILPPAALLEML
jgi:predicted nucleic acid-binding protein